METPATGTGFEPDAAINQAAGRFFELLKTFGAAPTGTTTDWSSLATPLATHFEQWLRLSQSAGPWFAAAAGVPGATAPVAPFPPAAWSFASLPLGSAAAPGRESQHALELFGRLGQLQAQLAAHWSAIANTAAQRFVARVGGVAAAPGSVDQALKLYELWVECAEEAYASTVHRSDFSRLQAEIANTSAALLVEQRRHAERLARAFGLPTRSEFDALGAQLQELRRELTRHSDPPPSRDATEQRSGQGTPRARGTRAPKRLRAKGATRSGRRRTGRGGPRR